MRVSEFPFKTPIRHEFWAEDSYKATFSELARREVFDLAGFGTFDFFKRMDENQLAIRQNFFAISKAASDEQVLTPAAEWLLDNHHVIDESFRHLRRDMTRGFFARFPTVETLSGPMPRVLAIAWQYVACSNSEVAMRTLLEAVDGYQTVEHLTIAELWAVPAMLRFVLLENLRRLSDRVEQSRQRRAEANSLADRLLGADRPSLAIPAEDVAKLHVETFAVQLLHRIRDGSGVKDYTLVERLLAVLPEPPETAIAHEHTRQSSGNVSTGNVVRSLRHIDEIDWLEFFEAVSVVDDILRSSQDYTRLNKRSRSDYWAEIERIAKGSSVSEELVAQRAVMLERQASDNGSSSHPLSAEGRRLLEIEMGYKPSWNERFRRAVMRTGWLALFVPAFLASLALTFGGLAVLPQETSIVLLVVMGLALFAPASDAAFGMFNFAVSLLVRPVQLPGYDFSDGVPAGARTLVVIPCILSDEDTVEDLVQNLELHYLANPQKNIFFAILSDWADAPTEMLPTDAPLLERARTAINALEDRYGQNSAEQRFFFLHRGRLYNPGEKVWMGWERKRGKLSELNQFLRGDDSTTFLSDHVTCPENITYVLTLDADTRLDRGAVAELAGRIAHPVNAPRVDPLTGIVEAGHGILQPRTVPSLTTGDEASIYQRTFSVDRGIDPYVFNVSDVYQDLFDEGNYTGKGIYHIDAFEGATAPRIGENQVLSHDLLEGCLARAGFVSDVQFIEDFPVRYEVDVSRQHRWARGDWQLLPFLLDLGNGLKPLHRLKIVDNLRRSLRIVAWVLASVLGWMFLDLKSVAFWQLYLVGMLVLTPVVNLQAALFPVHPDASVARHLRMLAVEFVAHLAETGLRLAFMMHMATVMADAIARTLYRMKVSRLHLLEWRTAQQVHKATDRGLYSNFARMGPSCVISASAAAAVAVVNPAALPMALPFVTLWLAAPIAAWHVSQSAITEDSLKIRDADRIRFRLIARRTWRYFEDHVTTDTNHLPPDNFQEVPEPKLATRTSPTNIGLYLLALVSARDFGWVSFQQTIQKIALTLGTVERLEKHDGHLFNWYDTSTLAVLEPRYISSVDSGNLAGHLIVLATALREWSRSPIVHRMEDFSGIEDTFNVFRRCFETLPPVRRAVQPLTSRLTVRISGFEASYRQYIKELHLASVRLINLSIMAEDIRRVTEALHLELQSEASRDLLAWAGALKQNCQELSNDAMMLDQDASVTRELHDLSERARKLAFDMRFGFLCHKSKNLLSIGYRTIERELDESCYDLLASEARLASFFAIAKGDLPTKHWFQLGRPVIGAGTSGVLLSWSGSMFEYLMPPLIMHEPLGSALNLSNNTAIDVQIANARGKRTPWGVSESAFNARDREMNYQYHAFGVATLGLNRNLADDHVIAPYASILAAQFKPGQALKNLVRLDELCALGRYGYYDAVDFTPRRLPEGQSLAVVRNYMAHHHGMSIVAIANAVLEGIHRERFHADPVIKAAELLLQEKAPREIIPVTRPPIQRSKSHSGELAEGACRTVHDPLMAPREVVNLSNGTFTSMITSLGTGYSKFDGIAVTRWRADPTLDQYGNHIFLRDVETSKWWSATPWLTRSGDEEATTFIYDHKAELFRRANGIETVLECIVAHESNAEGRRLTIRNRSDRERNIEVTTYGEIVLENADADLAHPAFSKMFVETTFVKQDGVILARRNQRESPDNAIHFAHMLADSLGVDDLEGETDRRTFIGRGRSIADPGAMQPGIALAGSDGFTLDPIYSLRRTFRIAPGKSAVLIAWNIVSRDKEALDEAVAHYRHGETFEHESRLAWTYSQIELRHEGTTLEEANLFRSYASLLAYPDARLAVQGAPFEDGLRAQKELWGQGISGDDPIIILRIDNEADLKIARKASRMAMYMQRRKVSFDLVLLNERKASYVQDLSSALQSIADRAAQRMDATRDRRRIFALRRDLMGEAVWASLLACGAIVLHARNGKLSEQLARVRDEKTDANTIGRHAAVSVQVNASTAEADGHGLNYFNGYGGFAPDAGEYVIRLAHGEHTPHPWINVVGRKDFGFHVSAEGAAYTWAVNSRDFQISPWSNDPVTNRPGEAFHIVDRQRGKVMTPFAALSRDTATRYECRHGLGYSNFTGTSEWAEARAEMTLAADGDAKLVRISVTNKTSAPLSLRIYGYLELVLGTDRARTARHIRVRPVSPSGIAARNPYSNDFGDREILFAADRRLESWTACREEYLGRNGDIACPVAIDDAASLKTARPNGDPCMAVACDVEAGPDETATVTFRISCRMVGEEFSPAANQPGSAASNYDAALSATANDWSTLLEAVQVKTPDPKFDLMVNTWLPYQSVSCRIRARSAFYQSSGAFGFRDQLQDTSALLFNDPTLAREQILNAAARQFPQGDFQHWWLPNSGAGVRTTISDDVVWLPHSVARYVEFTGDSKILDEDIHYIDGPMLEPGKHDAFFQPEASSLRESLHGHCARAIELAIRRTGTHGLPLMLGGDWNDGMNRVGEGGKGESVWLGWFLADTIKSYLSVARARVSDKQARAWMSHRKRLLTALDLAGWDGEWYRRGYYDDGSPLGSRENAECRIDSIAQSWAAITGGGDPDKARQALDSALANLVDPDARIVHLFTPPFRDTPRNPGYIKSYPPGVRENGGQYTHAAAWMVYALARAGRGNEAHACFDMINPISHASDKQSADCYRTEPYVVAADIYGSGNLTGRGGWTWYTGSAGWLYRAAVEGILGITLRNGEELVVAPALPDHWPGFEARVKVGDQFRDVVVTRDAEDLSVRVMGQTQKK